MKITEERLIKISLLICILTMTLGYKIVGRFAISNIGQIISFIILMPVILNKLKRGYLKKNIMLAILMVVGAAFSSLRYGISMHIGHIFFFVLVSFYFSYFTMNITDNGCSLVKIINRCFELATYIFIIPYGCMGFYGIVVQRKGYLSYMFDDKSHAVIFFAFFAFVALYLIDNKLKYVVSITYFVLSLTTTSRLGIIFIPFYLIAFYREFISDEKSLLRKLLVAIVAVFVIFIGISFICSNISYFTVFGRLGNSSGSTTSHIVLILYAIKIKFNNILNFLFGTGPGSFSNILVASNMDLSDIYADGGSYRAILEGRLPVHSSHFEILMDFSIMSFWYYAKFLVEIFINQMKSKKINNMLFFVAFMGAEIFYSTFHEILFFVILLYLFTNSFEISEKDNILLN